MRWTRVTALALFFAALAACEGDATDETSPTPTPTPSLWLAGVNLAGAEFGATIPGTFGVDYTYPTNEELGYFAAKGMNLVRVPFRWERLQPAMMQPLDAAELARLDAVVAYGVNLGVTMLIDPHNYARYNGTIVTQAQVADFWGRLAAHYAAQPLVAFGVMNEPHTMSTEEWLTLANASIDAIRDAGASNLVTVPGNGYTGAWSWSESFYGTPNAQVMLGVVDPLNNYVYEVHQYLDADSSGTSATCVSATIGAERVAGMTAWLRANGKRALLGEFGGADNPTCEAAIGGMLTALDDSRDVWVGWSWWAAGPWWGTYMFTLEPSGSTDAPQMAWLTPHL